ncbi:Nuclease [Folsomia candida]|uniref:Nuclease n=1 Tax=Folsomia candida TaxID=158441 RepID=A0A226DUA1_FOLCA|nr:Nuclease [Folsomia candida]
MNRINQLASCSNHNNYINFWKFEMDKILLVIGLICSLSHSGFALVELNCSVANSKDGIFTFTIPTTSRIGDFNMFFVQQEITRLHPWAVTAMYNYLNNEHNISRIDNFRPYTCEGLNQTECGTTFRMTPEQQAYSGRTSFDRGHLQPSHPFTFERDANDKTFYCFNIAPQEPFTNQQPWSLVESREDLFSPTNVGYIVPNHYWKLVCYKDAAGVTQVVGFIGNNTLLRANDVAEQDARKASTYLPRSQQEIINTMNINRVHLFQEAWVGGETYLLEGRSEDRLPSADECTFKRDLSPEVRQEWATYIGGFSKLE